jgi:hypothetical protein
MALNWIRNTFLGEQNQEALNQGWPMYMLGAHNAEMLNT